MAKCIKTTVKKEVITVKEIPVYNLELTEPEAKVLNYILMRIGGSPFNSARAITESIKKALPDSFRNYNEGLIEEKYSSIYFKNNTLGEFE